MSSEGSSTPAIAITPGHNCSHTHVIYSASTSEMHTLGALANYVTAKNSKCYFHARRSTGFKIRSVHAIQWKTSRNLFGFEVISEEPPHGGYAGVRLGEAQIPRPADHAGNTPSSACRHPGSAARSRGQTLGGDAQCVADLQNRGLVINERSHNVPHACVGGSDHGLMVRNSPAATATTTAAFFSTVLI